MPLAREHHTRVLVLDRDGDVRERLVVAQAHVERRPVPLDEVLLEVERLDLAAGDDHLEVGDPRHEPRDRGAVVAAALLEVGAHARPQRLRLADVEHVAALVPEEIDARLRRERLQFPLHVCHLGYLSQGVKRLLAAIAAMLVLPSAAQAGGSSVVFGAAEDRVRSALAAESELEMGLLRLAGFKAVRVTSFWAPGLSEPTPHEAMVLGNVGHGGGTPRRPRLRLGLQRGLAHDAAHPQGADGVRELRRRDRPRQPVLPRRDRRQRAEPEPLLAAAVRPARQGRLGACLPARCSRPATTPSRRPLPTCASGAARSPRAASTSRSPGATRSPPRASSASSARRTARAAVRCP